MEIIYIRGLLLNLLNVSLIGGCFFFFDLVSMLSLKLIEILFIVMYWILRVLRLEDLLVEVRVSNIFNLSVKYLFERVEFFLREWI